MRTVFALSVPRPNIIRIRDISNNKRVSEFALIRLDCLQNADVPGRSMTPGLHETEILRRSVRLDFHHYVPPQLRSLTFQLQDYLTVRPFKTIPEGSVHVHGSPAGPKPNGQTNLPTLHSRSEISSIRLPKNPRRSSVWRRDAVVVLVVAQDIIRILTEIKSQR